MSVGRSEKLGTVPPKFVRSQAAFQSKHQPQTYRIAQGECLGDLRHLKRRETSGRVHRTEGIGLGRAKFFAEVFFFFELAPLLLILKQPQSPLGRGSTSTAMLSAALVRRHFTTVQRRRYATGPRKASPQGSYFSRRPNSSNAENCPR